MRHHLLDDLEILLARGLGEDAREAALREADARLLLALEPERAVPMGEVALRLGRDPSTATRFVDHATGAGWVVRHPGHDRRRRLAALTPAGREIRARLQALRDERAAALPRLVRARTGLGEDEVEWFLEALVTALASGERRE
jgi:DNA-binding MarR family transcriptional regulator